MKLSLAENAVIWTLAWACVVAVTFGVNYLLALGVVWCAKEMFSYTLPFWPTFVGLIVLSAIFGGSRGK